MTLEEMKSALQEELKSFKEKSNFATTADLDKKFAEVGKYDDAELKNMLAEVKKAAETQGEEMRKLSEAYKNVDVKSELERNLAVHKSAFEEISKKGAETPMKIQLKTINASSFTNNRSNYSDVNIGEVAQGNPFILDLLRNSITVPAGNQGSIDYWYQGSPTNNAGVVAENAAATASSYDWTRATLGWIKINANIKVSLYQLADMNFVNSQVRSLLMKDFMLKLQDEIINGTGGGTRVNGLNSYATALSVTGFENSVTDADLVDVLNLIKNQIITNSKNKYAPTDAIMKNAILYGLQTKKNEFGMRVYPELAMAGTVPMINGMRVTSNELAGANALIVGDLSAATLYNWDGVMLEVIQTGDDALNQLVTLSVNARLNLLVKPTDTEAIVKVTDYATTLAAITAGA